MDSGQISYDQPLSKTYFKSAQAHNGLLVDEQGPDREINPEVVNWCAKDRIEFTAGRITHNGIVHQRSVLFVKPDYWVVVDHVRGDGTPNLTRLFHLPEVAMEKDAHSVRTTYPDGDNLWIYDAQNALLEMRDAPLMANNQPASPPTAAFTTKQPLPTALATVLVPFGDRKEIPTIELLPSTDPDTVSLKILFQNGRTDWIAISSGGKNLTINGRTAKGVALWTRTDATGTITDSIQKKP